MKHRLRFLPLIIAHSRPVGALRFARRDTAGAGRNSMADRPQDFCARLRSAVRPVQHLNPLFVDATIAAARSAVTRTDKWNVLRT